MMYLAFRIMSKFILTNLVKTGGSLPPRHASKPFNAYLLVCCPLLIPLWNTLPVNMRNIPRTDVFKSLMAFDSEGESSDH